MKIFKRSNRDSRRSSFHLEGSVQWHDIYKNSGFPNYGTIVAGIEGLHIQEDSYDDGGAPPDRWFIGWGYIYGSDVKDQANRIEVGAPGFRFYVYPNVEREYELWLGTLHHFAQVGGENIRQRF